MKKIIIILDGILIKSLYGKGLLFYNDDINSLMNKNKTAIYFEQDGALAPRCKLNKNLLN